MKRLIAFLLAVAPALGCGMTGDDLRYLGRSMQDTSDRMKRDTGGDYSNARCVTCNGSRMVAGGRCMSCDGTGFMKRY